jgi:hypothetical protein
LQETKLASDCSASGILLASFSILLEGDRRKLGQRKLGPWLPEKYLQPFVLRDEATLRRCDIPLIALDDVRCSDPI